MTKPQELDYSNYVTLIRNQDGRGGCGAMSDLHVFDIQMKRIAPYTPDGSFAFIQYVYNDSSHKHGSYDSNGNQISIKHDPRITKLNLDQMGVLKEYGCCPESTFHTIYDPPRQEFPNEPIPPNDAFLHARKYRVVDSAVKLHPATITELTDLLYEKGPLVFVHTPEGSSDGHAVALIGYNDNTQRIKYINSIGGAWGGIQEKEYAYFLGRLQNLGSDQGVAWMTVANFNPDRYTARINISHLYGRRFLWVRLGVEGRMPMTVWSFNCCVNMQDDTNNLVIDVPLPDYAKAYWPPKKGNWWYVEIIDSSPAGSSDVTGFLEDVVLVQRQFNSNFTSCTTVLTKPSSNHFPIKLGGTLKVYIPSRLSPKLLLSIDSLTQPVGGAVTFKCVLTNQIVLSNVSSSVVYLKGKKVDLFAVKPDPIEGTIIKTKVGTGITDIKGQCRIICKPAKIGKYLALAVEPSGNVIAQSNTVSLLF